MCGCCCKSKKKKDMDSRNSAAGASSSTHPVEGSDSQVLVQEQQHSASVALKCSSSTTSNNASLQVISTSGTVSGNFDWDALYDDSIPDSTSPDEPKQSVISYLWSQLRVGMDLTKITLPTYILERRSLLEMYADFFAHPDMFVAIADAPTPSLRMIAVTKWYLASFHAGRKSDLAKKPYNPILGEVFSCWWDSVGVKKMRFSQDPEGSLAQKSYAGTTSSETQSRNDPTTMSSTAVPPPPSSPKFNRNLITDSNRAFFDTDGSFLPWCNNCKNTLIFFGEQVSHHPPISAFYAEHPGKRICVNAHIWTKSKFMGLSVGVHNVGEATVCVQIGSGGKEEYILGFPSGYARSVLSVPWVELGGDVDINCAQTGYKCSIEFCTKTMLGNNRNRVIAKLYNTVDKKPYMVIDGFWNDVMSLKVPEYREKYLDTKTLQISKKETRPVIEQEVFESRRLWKDVTKALKYNDVDGATKAKAAVEERQRLDAKQREVGKSQWRPRMFEQSGEKWTFIQSLDKRPLT